MLIDTHVHTNRYSSCSVLDPIQLVNRALELELSGIAIMEHHHVWQEEEIADLKDKTNNDLLILRGQEITCSNNHLLIFGYYDQLSEHLSLSDVRKIVHSEGGVIILAHPFRNRDIQNLKFEDQKTIFRYVDGVEVLNANQTEQENEYGLRIWQTKGIIGIGGSDAHSVEMVGKYLTRFKNMIKDEKDLITEMKAGRCEPISLRNA